IRVMEKLRDDPALVSQLVRRACLGQLAEELEDTASHSQLDASALSRLAHAVEAIDFHKAERIALFGERATAFQAMTKSSTDLGGESPADEAALSATAGPIDKAFTLHVFR